MRPWYTTALVNLQMEMTCWSLFTLFSCILLFPFAQKLCKVSPDVHENQSVFSHVWCSEEIKQRGGGGVTLVVGQGLKQKQLKIFGPQSKRKATTT